jgi:hypothetical protein
MPELDVPIERIRFGQTTRKDAWWLQSVLTVFGLVIGFGYLGWGLFQPENYWSAPYLTPLASPLIFGESPHSWFGPGKPGWWPETLPLLPGLFILWFPGGFRITCYYYRGTYYKAFWADPPACAVGEPRKGYRGEHKFPLVVQNVHRYFLYFALVFIFILAYDVYLGTQFPVAPGADETRFGVGLGTLILSANVVLVSLYTFSCHSFRHLVGGVIDIFSRAPVRKKAWDCVSCLNRRHGLWAWLSLYSMCATDIYVRLLAKGIITDWRIF